jgi:hypothetical protein
VRTFIIIVLSFIDLSSYSQNYLVNGTFEEGLKNWRVITDSNGSHIVASIEIGLPLQEEFSACIAVTAAGILPSDSRFDTYLTVHKGVEIIVKYKMKANRQIFYNLELCRNYSPYAALYRSTETDSADLPADTSIQEVAFTLTPNQSDGNYRLSFLLGNLPAGDTLWIDDIAVEETQSAWDENIIANPEFDEYLEPEPGFPDYRKKRLFWGDSPNSDGGWEGGFCYGAPTEMIFDIDTTGKLSGKNSAYIHIINKSGTDFFNGAYTGFFQATQGSAYEFSFEAVASKNVTLAVAMNRQPFSNLESDTANAGPPYYAYAPDRFFRTITITPAKQTFTIRSDTMLTQCMHQVFFANFPDDEVEFWIDNVRLKRVESPYVQDPGDTITPGYSGNPVIRTMFTADPAALVHNDTFYIYTGHDEQAYGLEGYVMRDWHVFSSDDMVNWHDHGAVLKVNDFSWARADAFAGQCVEKDGKFYWYVPMSHKTINGFAIGVAVAVHPTGPFTDAIGAALITNNMTTNISITWDDIDPSVFIDDDGQAYLYWGNSSCKYVKLKENMIEIDGPIHYVSLPLFTEAPWLHKRNDMYYLSYASGWPEYIDYATSSDPEGPWTHRGRLNDYAENCSTNHQSILEFRGDWYFVYHNGVLPTGGDYRRSVCIDKLFYNEDGSIQPIIQSVRGVPEVPLAYEPFPRKEIQMLVYPNPVSNKMVQIILPEAGENIMIDVLIMNLMGQKIFQQEYLSGATATIALDVKSGIYHICLSTGQFYSTNKLIVL